MAKAKYAIDKDKNKVYMISHTQAIYDSNGQVLENRLQNMATESSDYTDTKIAALVNGAPETMDTLAELADAIENNETVVEALNSAIGTKANKTDVDTALDGKLDVDGDATNTTVGFTSASTRTNIATGETQSTLFGKIKKWFSDLKTVAFTGKYSDLTDTPTNATASTSGFMSSADKSKLDGIATGAQVNSVTGVKGDNESSYRTGNINITKANVGLGNVPNVTTNNQTPTYTDATTLSTLSSGEYLSTAFGKIKKAITEFINHKNNKSNPHSVTKSQVGLGNVDNTSDANKPISTAVKNALNDKLDGSWSDANGYSNISEISLDVSDLVGTVWGNLGSNNEFAGIYELGSQVSDNREAIDTKQATITGGASTITSSNLTASRALVSDSNGKVAVSAVTSTELGYIDGVTSNVQTQLNAKAPKSHASTATTYGTGTSSYYGHVKLSDSTSSTSSTGSGVAATPAAVKAAYDKAVSVQEDVVGMNNDVSQIISEKIAPPTTITIANNTSKHKSYADYICTGTSDQTVINNAIAALPDGGGKIVLLEGTYNISGSITVNKSNVTIEGMGNGTVLKRMFNDGGQWTSGVINITGNSCIVKELSIDGNNSVYTSSNNKGLLLIDKCSDNVLDNVKVYNEKYGIIAGVGATHNCIHQANISNVYNGVLLYYANYNTVSNCIISGVSNNGIECNWYSSGHIIEQNHISDITNAGIYVNSNCTREIISDNVVVKNNDTLYTIYIAGTYNIVVDNQLPNMNYTNTSSGTTNSFENNKT